MSSQETAFRFSASRRAGSLATLEVVDGGDHSFAVLQRFDRSEDEVLDHLVGATMSLLEWVDEEARC